MAKEQETIVWCPDCKVEKFVVWRNPIGDDGNHSHELIAPDGTRYTGDEKICECKTPLARKP